MARKTNHKRSKRSNTRIGQRASPKKSGGHRRTRKKSVVPRTLRQFSAMPARSQDRWNRVTHVVSKMRADGVSLKHASKEFGLDPRTVIRWAKPALRKRVNGRYTARVTDKLLRVLTIPSPEGVREIGMRDSRQASRLGQYWAAVRKYLATGDASGVEQFRGKHITDSSRKRIPLLTDLKELDRLGSAGSLSFEGLYAGVV